MGVVHAPLHAFNAGVVSRYAVARTDLERLRIAAEEQKNFLPRVLGPMVVRPGTKYIASTRSDAAGRGIPFVFNVDTTAYLEMTASFMRVLLSDGLLTRPTVSATVSNGDFTTDLAGWTDSDETSATSQWDSGLMSLQGNGTNRAIREQAVTITESGTEHALRLVVANGYITLRVGSTAGDDDYIAETVLAEGEHSLAFTPTTNFNIWLASETVYPSLLDSCNVEAAGVVSIPTPWTADDLDYLRYAQSGDVVWLADGANQPRRVERRAQRSWSVVKYLTADGPFRLPNFGATTLTPSGLSGSVALTASKDLFTPEHVGALFEITHSGQLQEANLAGADQGTGDIRVTGTGGSRAFRVVLTGTWTATVTLQRSFGISGAWEDVSTYTANTNTAINDGFDNQIVFYRLYIDTGDYTSGTVTAKLTYSASTQTGVARVTSYTSGTEVGADVLSNFSRGTASSTWSESEWSGYRGWPSSVTLFDGRLWWAGRDKIWGSISDAFDSFDETFVGDAGPINRSIATGGVDGIYWLLPIQRLLAGTAAQEVSIRASGFDEPLTPTAFTVRAASNRGSANLPAVGIDSFGVFVQRNLKRVFELVYTVQASDYTSRDLTRLAPDICDAGVVRIAAQRTPDTRIWFVLADGTCAVLTYERDDEVIAWSTVDTDGTFEDVCVVAGEAEDEVYFIVNRTIGGATKRYIEELARLDEVTGGTLSKTVDSHVVYSGAATTTITGLGHLEGESVKVWADGAPLSGSFTVSLGQITLGTAASDVVVGLSYDAKFQSAKLAYGGEHGTAMTMPKRVSAVGLIMADVTPGGVRIGRTFDAMGNLPSTYGGTGRALLTGEVIADYEYGGAPFNGGWDTNSRICIKVSSPYCATFLGAVIEMETTSRVVPEPRGNG